MRFIGTAITENEKKLSTTPSRRVPWLSLDGDGPIHYPLMVG
jgi:hypothetical protein